MLNAAALSVSMVAGSVVAATSADVESPNRPIAGRVIDSAGQGVVGLMVQAIHDNPTHTGRTLGVTRADGSFLLRSLPGLAVNVVVGSGKVGFAFKPGVAPGSENVLMQLHPGGTIRVRARAADGQPMEGLSVQGPVGINGGHYLELHGSRTGADGVALLPVPVGEIDVVVRNGEGRTVAVVRKRVVPGVAADADVLIEDTSRDR